MNRRRWLLAWPSALVGSPTLASLTMTAHTVTLQPRPLLPPAVHINTLRFALHTQPPVLYGMGAVADGEWPLWPLPALQTAADTPPVLRLPSLFGAPSWDLAMSSAGPAAVWSRPGSAISPLWTRVAAQDPAPLSRDPMGVYAGPRLVRGGGAGSGVTAVTEVDAVNRLALVARREPQRLLPIIGSGRLIAGQLVHRGPTHWLFALCLPPGPRMPERQDLRGESLPCGMLYAAPLDNKLVLAGAIQQPFGEQRIYEFDVDSTGSALTVAATSPRGWRAARGANSGAGNSAGDGAGNSAGNSAQSGTESGTDSGAAWTWVPAAEAEVEAPLFSPSLLAAADGVMVAMLQDGPAGRRLMLGRL